MDDVFTDIPRKDPTSTDSTTNSGSQYLSSVASMSMGTATKSFRATKDGLWLGANRFADAPFSVTMAGILKAVGAQISGDLRVGGQNNDDGTFSVFDNDGNLLLTADTNGLSLYQKRAMEFIDEGVGTLGYFGPFGTDGSLFLETALGIALVFSLNGGATFQMGSAGTDTLQINGNENISGDLTIGGTFNPSSVAVPSGGLSLGGHRIYVLNGDAIFDKIGTTPTISVGGAIKTAIVPTSKGYRALYCTESPEVWFMDFCPGKIKPWWKFWQKEDWKIEPDPLFLETIEEVAAVMPTGVRGMVQIWGRRKGFDNTRMEEKTQQEYDRNNEFWSYPTRKGGNNIWHCPQDKLMMRSIPR